MVFLSGEAVMIRYTTGDILRAETEALVNTVNCVGVMGRGIALQFKQTFPDNFKAYAAACKREAVRPGQMFVFETAGLLPRFIINFPTKRHWRGKSRMEDIEDGLRALVDEIRAHNIHSIAIPPLGSGLGGLSWQLVRQRIESTLSQLSDVDVLVFEPVGAPDERTNRSSAVPKMTAGRAALVSLMRRYLGALLDPSISLLEVHKLMYFLQAVGEPLRLRYVKAPYGPYAENLRHVLREVEGHLISGYADGGDTPDKPLALVPGAIEEADAFLSAHEAIHARLNQTSTLVEGFETAYGLELLSTVHWIVMQEGITNLPLVTEKVHAWSTRKRQFTGAQINLAYDRLQQQGWFAPRPC